LTLAFTVFSFLRFTYIIISLPPFIWDSLTYHLTNIAHWVQAGRIELFDTSMTRIYTPANYETYAMWFTIFPHHDVIVEAAGLPAYFIGVIATYVIARMLDLSRAASWIGALTYASLPALLIAVTGTKNDPHMAGYYLAVLALALRLTRARNYGSGEKTLGHIMLIVGVVLLAFGTKAYWLHILPGIALILVIGLRTGSGTPTWLKIIRQAFTEWQAISTIGKASFIVILGSALFIGFYWNSRNWVLTGNPFFPYGVKLEGEQILSGAERDAVLGMTRLQQNLQSFLEKFGDQQGRIGPDLTDTTGWGWFIYALGLPAWIWSTTRRREMRILSIGMLLSFVLIFLSIRPSPWNMRYLLWLPALFSVGFAVVYDLLRVRQDWVLRAINAMIVFTIGFNFISVWNYGRISPEEFARLEGIPILERGAADFSINMPFEYQNSLSIVPGDAILGYNVGSNGFIYPLYRPDYSQRLTYIAVEESDSCHQIADRMTVKGTRYLFVAPVHTTDEVLGILHLCGEAGEVLRERSVNLYVVKPAE
jgi:hypothetical protein